jgi:hypothetical protein
MTEVSDFSTGYLEDADAPAGRTASGAGSEGPPSSSRDAPALAAPAEGLGQASSCGLRVHQGLSFTGKGCHDSVRVVIPDRGGRLSERRARLGCCQRSAPALPHYLTASLGPPTPHISLRAP